MRSEGCRVVYCTHNDASEPISRIYSGNFLRIRIKFCFVNLYHGFVIHIPDPGWLNECLCARVLSATCLFCFSLYLSIHSKLSVLHFLYLVAAPAMQEHA